MRGATKTPPEQDQRTVGQMRADALFEMCRHALGCKETDQSGVRTTIVVRMDKRDLDAGRGLGRIDGTDQPVSVGQLRRLAGDAGIIPEVLGGDSEVLDLGRTKRMFTRAQRIALVERDGGCAKCHAPPEHCEAHHIRWWDQGGGTDLTTASCYAPDATTTSTAKAGTSGSTRPREFHPATRHRPVRRPRPGGLAALELHPDAACAARKLVQRDHPHRVHRGQLH